MRPTFFPTLNPGWPFVLHTSKLTSLAAGLAISMEANLSLNFWMASSRVEPVANIRGKLLNAVAAVFFSTDQITLAGLYSTPWNIEYSPRPMLTPARDLLCPTARYRSIRPEMSRMTDDLMLSIIALIRSTGIFPDARFIECLLRSRTRSAHCFTLYPVRGFAGMASLVACMNATAHGSAPPSSNA